MRPTPTTPTPSLAITVLLDLRAASQNLKRTMNCTCRGKPVPLFGDALLSLLLLKFKVELMIPKPPLGVTGEYKNDPHQGEELSEPARCRMAEEIPSLDSRRAPELYCGALTPLTWHSCPLRVHVRNRAAAGRGLLQHESPCCSELQAQHQLDFSRRAEPSGVGIQLTGDVPEGGTVRDIGVRIAVNRMVEQVKRLGAKLQVQSFSKDG